MIIDGNGRVGNAKVWKTPAEARQAKKIARLQTERDRLLKELSLFALESPVTAHELLSPETRKLLDKLGGGE